jgi:hypothetical protein
MAACADVGSAAAPAKAQHAGSVHDNDSCAAHCPHLFARDHAL